MKCVVFHLLKKPLWKANKPMEKGNRLTSPSPSAQKGGWDEMIAPPLSIEEERKRKSTGEHFCFRKEKKRQSLEPSMILPMQKSASRIQHNGSGSLESDIPFVTPKIEIIQQVFMCEFRYMKTHSFLGKIRLFACSLSSYL